MIFLNQVIKRFTILSDILAKAGFDRRLRPRRKRRGKWKGFIHSQFLTNRVLRYGFGMGKKCRVITNITNRVVSNEKK